MSQDNADTQQIARQTVRGSLYSLVSSGITISLGFLRAVLLARLLLPEHFGVMTLALFYATLIAQGRAVGLEWAFVSHQHADESVQRTYVTIYLAVLLLTVLLMAVAAPLIGWLNPGIPQLSSVLLVLAGLEIFKGLTALQETWFSKELGFRQLALINIASSITMTLVAPTLAWMGWGVWALVSELVSGLLARTAMSWLVFRRWTPRLGWDPTAVRWFWRYVRATLGMNYLYFLLDRFDDFWIGTVLGKTALGYYSRAFEFAQYPRRIIATPLVNVFHPVFARLQADRLRLSQAFYRAAYIILRASFLFAGAFALIMPEFIDLVIGEQWRPMLLTFRLMLIYTLLDTLGVLGSNLLLAVGRPQQARATAFIQILFFIPAVILGAQLGGINGVALAANGMVLTGCVVILRYVRQAVDLSLTRLFAWPIVALIIAWSSGLALELSWNAPHAWLMGGAKLLLFAGLYLVILLTTERSETLQGVRWLRAHLPTGQSTRRSG